ncbi:glycine--tRNA ligase subunit beta [Telmatospirillum siberiense]|uniref:Glycine--tRNA ligase beta subunit n=1 Tax=Telmatospirillum siberiense TaxID=382514 RepID=A0A2N3PPB6_9PROT|nr:glycine--tRNA ligase subunit beta [Telmatospirillum siberiense]PKU22259.1 glycine--tRNA ligase subunit beta [Telmatospirillum siberiense]
MAEFLLELFSEEIPARMQARAAEDLGRLVGEGLRKNGLTFGDLRTLVTPRRLTLAIEGLPTATPDISEERRGPRVGAPAQALDGFLKGAGVTQAECEERDTGKGVFYFAVISRKGRPTADVLKDVVEQTLADFPWPKSMRWGSLAVRWVRPLQSILALFDGKVVPISFGPVTAGERTRGHRFLAPAVFPVTSFADYAAKLAAAKVVLDPAERRESILDQAEKAAAREGLILRQDEGLLAEVTGLVEWPVVLVGTIDQAFMDVPDEVLITSMRAHQKYFSLLKADGRLANRFLVVSNMETADAGAAIVAGNERVLRARLSDAKFFWDTDRKHRLESRLPKLAERLYYAKLGTMSDKVERVAALSRRIAQAIGADENLAERAARLSKADLSSEMVGEFPELQGVMGRYYALADGEPAAVADAIADHYAPQGPNDRCPTNPLSVAVALADKLDSLTGFFAIDEKPTGSKDPFALRRAALGVIRLILENGLRLSLKPLFIAAHAAFTQPLSIGAEQTALDLLDFFADRLKVHLREKGVRHDLITGIFALGGEDDLVRLLARVDALTDFLSSEDGANLLTAYRRAANIVRIEEKKDEKSHAGDIDPALLEAPEEKALQQGLGEVRQAMVPALAAERFADAMTALARLRRPVDAFFEAVTVNCDAPAVRLNRLRLLAQIGAAMGAIADFSKIEG